MSPSIALELWSLQATIEQEKIEVPNTWSIWNTWISIQIIHSEELSKVHTPCLEGREKRGGDEYDDKWGSDEARPDGSNLTTVIDPITQAKRKFGNRAIA